jgi:cell wall-associated NlpC family hydrolase
MNIPDKYIGVPYVNKGRDFNGADCWGLVWLFIENELKVEYQKIFDYTDHNDVFTIEKYILDNIKKFWKKTVTPKYGDVVVFYMNGRFKHIGIMINNRQFLHSIQGKNSCIENIYSVKWNKRVGGFYELK